MSIKWAHLSHIYKAKDCADINDCDIAINQLLELEKTHSWTGAMTIRLNSLRKKRFELGTKDKQTVIALNDFYILKIVPPSTNNRLNASYFFAEKEWVIEIDKGERYATRYNYTTKHAKDNGLYFVCGNPKAAIQQAIIDVVKDFKLPEIFFIIIPTL